MVSKELGRIMSEAWAGNTVLKIREGSGSLAFGSLAVVKGSVDLLFEGVESIHSRVKCCANAFNFFSDLRGLKRSFLEAFICFDIDVSIFAMGFIE